MIKEIEAITDKLLNLSSLENNLILQEKDLLILKNAKKAIFTIKKDIDSLLDNASLLSLDDPDIFLPLLTKMGHLLSSQAIAINEIYSLSIKFTQGTRTYSNSLEEKQ